VAKVFVSGGEGIQARMELEQHFRPELVSFHLFRSLTV
jgi:hypothetical protein